MKCPKCGSKLKWQTEYWDSINDMSSLNKLNFVCGSKYKYDTSNKSFEVIKECNEKA